MEEKRLLKRKKKANESGNLEQLSHYCRELGDYYRKVGKCDEALQQFKEEENINVALNRPIAIAVSNRMIGEIYCDIGDFKEALKYQEKHLGIAKREKNGIEEQRALANLGRTYFCMAESITASERKEYESYLSSAKKVYIRSLLLCDDIQGIGHLVQMEMRARLLLNIGLVLECQGNLNEAIDYIGKACKTMLIISELLELKNAPYVEVAGSYLKARELAVRAEDWKLLVTTLHCLQSYQKNSALEDLAGCLLLLVGAEETERECKGIKERHQVQMSSDDEGGSGEEGGSTFGGSIDLNELAESGSDDEDGQGNQLHLVGDQADRRSKRRKATFRSLAVQRNEKGETALHRACISGNTTLVRRLIERGHPLNIRDNCGWTPLHEACNHGHEDIVAVLIESGAQVNDRGGTLCGGVTPIHDAASCGNLSVVRMLLDARALLTVKTDKGETPLDCLRQWYGRVRDEVDSRTEEEFRGLEEEMSRSLEKIAGQEPPALTLKNERRPRKSNTLQEDSGSEPLISISSGSSILSFTASQ
ncbi:tonsoku-like protein [Hetaerina americana]|uniref:tonsoku-like protein n=1 Tax=Hetaerina americana TaxID=62018 RepID=UPI003A7F4B97